MRDLIQIFATVMIALGAGLYAFGRHLDPPINAATPAAVVHPVSDSNLFMASMACGWGVGFMTLGVLSLAIPWMNIAVAKYGQRTNPGSNM
jgi:hypothetical protein